VATFTKLKSGSWRVQVRRKRKYVNNTFLRRKDAEEWALEIEHRIDRRDPTVPNSRDVKTFGDFVRMHRCDLQEVGQRMGRSKTASLAFLERKLGRLRLSELDRERLIQFGKERAREGAGPVTVGIDLGYNQDDPFSRGSRSRRSSFDGGSRIGSHCFGSTWPGR
jgi:hypothetical protein